jgi:N-acetylneuraminic acid mutarotase
MNAAAKLLSTNFRSALLAGLSMVALTSCGGGGGGDDSFSCLYSAPRITSSAPTIATAGYQYTYPVSAAYNCAVSSGVEACYDVVAVQLPAGASSGGNSISWTPPASEVNAEVNFLISTRPDICGNRATQSWTVHVYAPPVIESFTAERAYILPRESAVLTAVFQGSGRIVGLGSVASGVPIATSALSASTNFTLIVSSSIGVEVRQTLIIEVKTTIGTWQATSTTVAPSGRTGHTAVWTGSEMIVWGGNDGVNSINSGARYDPVTDVWVPTSTFGAPSTRTGHAAIWTGREMIVWGGLDLRAGWTDSGARYNPVTDVWTPTSTTGAPSQRTGHTAVWTGSEMIVWGGNSGARYNPVTDAWAPTSTISAPSQRTGHRAVWTGREMIVWGGFDAGGGWIDSGARYNPVTDTWLPISSVDAPSARFGHTAIWTGSEMIIWGGENGHAFLAGGARYNPVTDVWASTSDIGVPSARSGHTSVWTGSEMIIWGGANFSGATNSGAVYNPVTYFWLSTSPTDAPDATLGHIAVWTGSEMIVWGGGHIRGIGGKYRP